jgi:WD40 repeat protein
MPAPPAHLLHCFRKRTTANAALVLAGNAGLATLVMLVVLAPGFGQPPGPPPQDSSPSAAGRDLYGDPLPPGALARLGTIKRRPSSGTLMVTPDGKTVMGVDYSRRVVRYFDAATGELRRTCQVPGAHSSEGMLSPTGKYLAVGEDFGVNVWDLEAPRLNPRRVASREDLVQATTFLPDGHTLAVMTLAPQCHLLNLETGKERRIGALDAHQATQLAADAEGKRLVMWAIDDTLRCWGTGAGKELWRAKIAQPRSLAFSPDGARVILRSGADAAVVLLDAATGKTLAKGQLPPGREFCLSCACAGNTLALLLSDRVLFWDLHKNAVAGELAGVGSRDGRFWEIAFSPDGRSLYAVGSLLQCWDVATGRPLYRDTGRLGHTGVVLAVAFSPDGRRVASAAKEDTVTVRIWDVASRRLLHTLPGHGDWGQAFLQFTSDGRHLIATGDGIVRVWDNAGKEVRQWDVVGPRAKHHSSDLRGLALSNDGRTVVSLLLDAGNSPLNGRAGTVSLWDSATGKRLLDRPGIQPLFRAAVSATGRLVILEDGTVYDIVAGTRRQTLVGGEEINGNVGEPALAISPDGLLAAEGLWKYFEKNRQVKYRLVGIQVWEVVTGKPIVYVETDDELEDGCGLAFHPDGRRLLVVGPETLRLYDMVPTKEVWHQPVAWHLLNACYGPLAFSPDGRTLATGHTDTSVLLWNLPATTPAGPASVEQVSRWWKDLASESPLRGFTASLELAARPDQAVAMLRERLRPVAPVAAAEVRGWIADLDSEEFARRDAATRRLTEHGRQVEAALRQTLARSPSPETRKRIEGLLEAASAPHGEELRQVRAVHVLRRIKTGTARELMDKLGQGDRSARLTQEALESRGPGASTP